MKLAVVQVWKISSLRGVSKSSKPGIFGIELLLATNEDSNGLALLLIIGVDALNIEKVRNLSLLFRLRPDILYVFHDDWVESERVVKDVHQAHERIDNQPCPDLIIVLLRYPSFLQSRIDN